MPYQFRSSYHGASKSRYSSSNNRRGGSSSYRSGGRNKRAAQYINPSRFIKEARPVTAEEYVPTHRFADFPVIKLIHDNVEAKGFVNPSPIQDQTIPLGLEGRDVIGIANTGTGKTAAFAIPVLNKLVNSVLADNAKPSTVSRALIVAPTRELAQQIEQECREIGKGSMLYGAVLIGGSSMGIQLKDLRSDPQIVIGTPGRIKDHLDRGTLDLSRFDTVVLDEVDRMLDMGFVNDMRDILAQLKTERQSFFFSATMDERVRGLINTFANDPVTVAVKTGETSDNVHQDVVRFSDKNQKVDKLHDLLISGKVGKAIIFDETQRSVERLNKTLMDRGFDADAIHGGKTQGQRLRALNKFKKNEITILVATDVAARGIDVADVTHVINFTQPQSYEDYVHRIGRAGRAGRTGYALTFVEGQ